MSKISLGILLATLHLTHTAFGCDYRLLETEAQSYNHRIWSNASVDIDTIKDSLSFLEDDKEVDSKYSTRMGFENFFTNIKAQNKKLINFLDKCEEIYNTTVDHIDKVAVYMLAEAVWDKYINDLNFLDKTTKFRQNRFKD